MQKNKPRNAKVLSDLEKISSIIPAPLYWEDLNSVILGGNEQVFKQTGALSAEAYVGKTLYELYPEEMATRIKIHNEEVIRTKKILSQEEPIEDITTGEFKYFTAIKAPIYDDDGNVIGIVGTSIDITDRKKLEEELKLEKEKSEAANEAKSEFLRNMRHDLRTPFTGIISLGEHLAKTENDLHRKELLQIISESGTALLAQLNEIFQFLSSTDIHKPVLDVPFNLTEMAKTVAATFGPIAIQKKLPFQVNVSEQLPLKVIGDRIRTEQVLMALLSNAFKFTEQGAVTLTVGVVKTIENKPLNVSKNGYLDDFPTRWALIEFMIADTGPGIPPDKQEAAFERFGRLHASYKESEYSGKGFGLSLVKRRVDEMEGELQLESTEGKGSVFRLLIPYKLSLAD